MFMFSIVSLRGREQDGEGSGNKVSHGFRRTMTKYYLVLSPNSYNGGEKNSIRVFSICSYMAFLTILK